MSNSLQRVVTALIAIPVIVLISMVGNILFFTFVALISAVALLEFYRLAEAKGAKPQRHLGVVAGFFINIAFYHVKLVAPVVSLLAGRGTAMPFPSQTQLLIITLIIIVAVLALVELFRNNGSAIINLSVTLLGLVYISLFFGTLIGIRELFVPIDFPVLRYFPGELSVRDPAVVDTVYRWGGLTVVSVFAVIWICDSAAYYGGRFLGRRKLFPRVSPNKTWEGAIAGFLFAIAAAVAAKYLALPYLEVSAAVVIGCIIGVFGQLGDLIESLLKRDAGVKDSSTLIPGHGGVFDRFDSLLLVSPIIYLYLDFIVFG